MDGGESAGWLQRRYCRVHPHLSEESLLEPKQRMRGTTSEIQQRARELRQRMTIAERFVWTMLRKQRQRGFHFRRQHPVGRFILDFYCAEAKLCIEIDGPIHDNQCERDAERTAWLEATGLRVIRFRNDEVMDEQNLVYQRIQAALEGGA
jgi:very-short-patch-repair endonuclease